MYTATGTLDKTKYLEQYAPLVKRIAHHMMSRLPASVQVGDLIQAGLIGLMDAVSRYEEAQGVQFEAYASQRIRGAMIDELRANDWFPRSVRKNQRALDQSLGRLEQKLGRAPSEAEAAEAMNVSLEQYREMLADAHGFQLVFFEDNNKDDDDSDYMERHGPVERDDPLKKLTDARFKKVLVAAIEALPEREKLLMGLYYDKEMNFKEIAAVLGVTESRICQLHSQAVARLRGKLKGWKPE